MKSTEHTTKTPKATTPLFALLCGFLSVKGGTVPFLDRAKAPFRIDLRARVMAPLIALVALALFAFTAGPANATEVHLHSASFGSAGSGPGQFTEPEGVAVNDETGDVYVVDKGNDRVEYFAFNAVKKEFEYAGQFNGSGELPGEGRKAGSGALPGEIETGKFSGPVWVAVDNCTTVLGQRCSTMEDPSVGDVYVTDNAHKVIDKFSASGAYLGQVTTGAGGARFFGLDGVAVDRTGEVWVDQSSNERYEYDPEPAEEQVDNYSNTSANEFLASREIHGVRPRSLAPGFAVGPEDDLYTNVATKPIFEYGTIVQEYNSAGEHFPYNDPLTFSGLASAIAVDLSSGTVYLAFASEIVAFDIIPSSGIPNEVESFGSGSLSAATGIAVAPVVGLSGGAPGGSVYVADAAADRVVVFDEVSIPEVVSEPASSAIAPEASDSSVDATLHGTVKPDGESVTACEFEYGTTTSYGKIAPCEHPDAAEIDKGLPETKVKAEVTGLAPGTTYHFRLRAANENDEAFPQVQLQYAGKDETFFTPGPGIESASVSDVVSTAAKFGASIDPDGAATSVYFEYGQTTAYGSLAPAAPGQGIGAGNSAVEVGQQAQAGLLPGTVYHYRVVARSEYRPGEFAEFAGPDQTFTTQGTASGFALPDGRQYELVSPPVKQGALFRGAPTSEGNIGVSAVDSEALASVTEAAASGDAFAAEASQPTEAEPQGNANGESVLMSRDAAGAWSSQVVSSSHREATGSSLGYGQETRMFSEDLSHAVVDPPGSFTPLSPEAVEQTAYLRTNFIGGAVEDRCEAADTSPRSCFEPLVSRANTAPGVQFGDEFKGQCTILFCGPRFLAGNASLSAVILGAREQLTEEPVTVNEELADYEWHEGSLTLVNVLPGASAGGGANAVWRAGDKEHIVSKSGRYVLLEGTFGTPDVGGLFLRDVVKGETVQLNPAGAFFNGASHFGGGYQTANAEDTRVFFLSEGLTSYSAGGQDLYECEIVEENDKDKCNLTDLTPPAGGEPADVVSVMGTSEDGSYVYFIADGVLGDGAARGAVTGDCNPFGAGSVCNLYVRHEGVTSFIARLSNTDMVYDANSQHFARQRVRVSPDGRWLAFMSNRSLTGYDNHDAVSGEPDEEVYLYHAPEGFSAGAGSLSCASCDLTGARPAGVVAEGGVGLAASTPEFFSNGYIFPPESVHQPRYLNDSGRLLFDAKDALVPSDIDGVIDVYEYEPEGVPSGVRACSSATQSGSEVFKPAHSYAVQGVKGEEGAGCVALISSGTSSEPSTFLDASESGSDVFFLTSSRLTSNDREGGLSIFDAQECTSSAPCLPEAPVAPPECNTEGSCKAPPTPQPAIYGEPPSATFSGPGNLTPEVAPPTKKITKKTVKCERGFVKKRIKKKEACVKTHKKAKKAKRATNDRRVKR